MAQQTLDTTQQESLGRALEKINAMLTELYTALGGGSGLDPSVTTLTASGLATVGDLKVDTGTKTATATGGAATLAKASGVITSEALTTAAAAAYTLTLTCTGVAATDQVFASVQNGTNTQGVPVITRVTPGTNQIVIVVTNLHASEALNGTIKIAYVALKA